MIRLLTGDCRTILPTLADASVQCVVTSPPYYGLRDYGTARWEGGADDCDHQSQRSRATSTLMNDGRERIGLLPGHKYEAPNAPYRDMCGKCGARRIDAQLGLEASPDAYIAAMVGVFREVRRVLRNDGVMFLNVGDSYNNRTKVRASSHQPALNNFVDDNWAERSARGGVRMSINDGASKEKDLLMMPARLALALQAGFCRCDGCGLELRTDLWPVWNGHKTCFDCGGASKIVQSEQGWWLRSDIIWAKPNPMPESCTDRPTSAHEHIFLLTKRSRYFYDADAVREALDYPNRTGSNPIYDDLTCGQARDRGRAARAIDSNPAGRNLRNVWTIATAPYSAAHFATFPPELAERCIRAGTSERGCCAACGAPWVRVTERTAYGDKSAGGSRLVQGFTRNAMGGQKEWDSYVAPTTTGWSPSCGHTGNPVPCVVLDPFSGAGTALLVADRLGRDAIGIDLSHAYVEMTRERLTADCPLFMAFEASPPPAEDPEDARMADLFQDMAAD